MLSNRVDNNIIEMSRAEAGNIEYCMFFPMDSDDDICILEKWESKENIEAHQKTLLRQTKRSRLWSVPVPSYAVTI